MDEVILVDAADRAIGTADKVEAHRNGGQLNIEDPSDGFGCRIRVRLRSAES